MGNEILIEWNGTGWNGTEWNRIEQKWNEMEQKWNGRECKERNTIRLLRMPY